jgi:RNA polymerase sigma-70 factor (ECF subfamily)
MGLNPGVHAEDLDSCTDRELVAFLNDGDVAAFEVLYFRYRDWVVGLASRLTGDDDAALDVTQETFLYVLRKFPGFRLTAQFKTFLYPAVRNLSIAARQKARRTEPLDGQLETTSSEPAAPTEQLQQENISEILEILSTEQREVLLLRFVDDLSLAEVASAMEIPLGTVKSRLHNALETLRQDPRTKNLFEK